MEERSITERDIQFALQEHSRICYPSRHGGGKWVYEGRNAAGKRLAVVTKPAVEDLPPNSQLLIISVYWRDEPGQ